MIEEVLDVSSQRCSDTLSEVEIFMETQIHPPRAGAIQRVALCKLRVAEYVGSNRRKVKGSGVPDLVTVPMIHVTDDHRSE